MHTRGIVSPFRHMFRVLTINLASPCPGSEEIGKSKQQLEQELEQEVGNWQ